MTIDHFAGAGRANKQLLSTFEQHYPVCGKGIELLPDNSNPRGITEGVQQLRFATAQFMVETVQ